MVAFAGVGKWDFLAIFGNFSYDGQDGDYDGHKGCDDTDNDEDDDGQY